MAVDLAQKAQNFTNRGRQALETGRYELAVDMLMEAVSAAPDVLETRRLLRAAQIANFRRNGKTGFGAKLGYKMAQMKIMGLVKKWPRPRSCFRRIRSTPTISRWPSRRRRQLARPTMRR